MVQSNETRDIENISLSICIPTYNRANYLPDLLESIAAQLNQEFGTRVEICISDNASTDGTESVVEAFCQKNRQLIVNYSRNTTNIGADRNYLKVASMAKGRYCWFMGSDDLLCDGAVSLLLQEIQSGVTIVLFNRVRCDIEMNPVKYEEWTNCSGDTTFDLCAGNQYALANYFDQCNMLGGVFAYLSSIVFERARWNMQKQDEIFIGTAYSHVAVLLKMLMAGATLKYLKNPLVLCRGDNDSFAASGTVARFMLDINGYQILAEQILKEQKQAYVAFLKILTRQHGLASLVMIRSCCTSAQWSEVCRVLKMVGFNKLKLMVANLLGLNAGLIKFARKAKRSNRLANKVFSRLS